MCGKQSLFFGGPPPHIFFSLALVRSANELCQCSKLVLEALAVNAGRSDKGGGSKGKNEGFKRSKWCNELVPANGDLAGCCMLIS